MPMPRGKASKGMSEEEAIEVVEEPKAAKEPKVSSAKASRQGKLALAREATNKILKTPDWRVILDPDQLRKPLPHIPTGSLIVDYLIGGEPNKHGVLPCPGLPRGRVTQLWGHETSGKTTLALTAAATCIAQGGTVLYIDWENDIVPDYAAALGVPIGDDTKFELAQPETLEEGIKIATIYATAGVDLIIFDSVGAGTPQRIAGRSMEEVAEQAKVGELQAVWSQELNNLKRVINRSKTAILGISQVRAKISTGGGGHGPTTQPQGGNAWKFYSSIRLELRRFKQESANLYNALIHKKDERVVGAVTACKVIKCKLSKSQGREELFYIMWGEGIDDLRSVMEIGTSHGVIKKSGAWFAWTSTTGEEVRHQGVKGLREYFKTHPDQFKVLCEKVMPFLGSTQFADTDMEEVEDDKFSVLTGDEAAEELKEGEDLSEAME
jgi:recombination protein RecA